MTPDATKTDSKEVFDYYVGPLNVKRVDYYKGLFEAGREPENYGLLPPADIWARGATRGTPILVNDREYIAFTASEPAPPPLGAVISGRHVTAGASASLHLTAHLIAIAMGQFGNSELTLIPLGADDPPVGQRLWEISGARAQVESRLRSLSGLSTGWLDGEGVAPTATAVATARHLIWVLLNHGVDRPRLAPTPEGGVEAEWTVGNREVSVTFEPDGSLYGNAADVTTGEISEPELNPADHQAVADFVLGRA